MAKLFPRTACRERLKRFEGLQMAAGDAGSALASNKWDICRRQLGFTDARLWVMTGRIDSSTQLNFMICFGHCSLVT